MNRYSFYAAFTASEEYRLFAAGRPLGTMPADLTLYSAALLIFAGRRWKVTAIEHDHKIIEAVPAPGGRPRCSAAASKAPTTGSLARYVD